MFRIKICGVTNVEDAKTAVEAGAGAIGLNFYDKSPRHVTEDMATAIVRQLRAIPGAYYAPYGRVASIGVFVNHSLPSVHSISRRLFLTGSQFHGDETPEFIAGLARVRKFPKDWWNVIRARRFDDSGVSGIAQDLAACEAAGRRPNAVLIDALSPGRYGGTGETVSWVGLADHKKWLGDTPLILAGGLTPDNVAEAIRIVRPHAVDVASGVESAPGKKDPHKVRDFIQAAKAAFGI
jgi:phosphoribosylanthranilate isomerase